METKYKEQLISKTAAKVHEVWCESELRAFYSRFTAQIENKKNIPNALHAACKKNNKQRNVLELNINWLNDHELSVTNSLKTFEGFLDLFNKGYIIVKRFTARKLTEKEQKDAGKKNYNSETQEENILRPFDKLSADSKKENLEAARGAVFVYEEYAKRGATIEQFSSPKAKHAIGTLIHADWMRRNEITESNKHLFVPFKNLDNWQKQQDLDVFATVIEEVKKDKSKYAVAKEDNLKQLHPDIQEKSVLDAKIPERAKNKLLEESTLRF